MLDDESLERLREAIWSLTGLIRVWLRRDGAVEDEPLALEPGATIADVADAIHHDLGRTCVGARVWGPSARFDGQRVGRGHVVADGDAVEVLTTMRRSTGGAARVSRSGDTVPPHTSAAPDRLSGGDREPPCSPY